MQTNPELIKFLIADDHPLALAGVRKIMEKEPDIQIVGEAQNGEEVKELVAKLHPKILLLDLKMPGTIPWKLENWVRENYPETISYNLSTFTMCQEPNLILKRAVFGFFANSFRQLFTKCLSISSESPKIYSKSPENDLDMRLKTLSCK